MKLPRSLTSRPAALENALMQALGEAGLGILQSIDILEAADDLQFDVVLNRDLVDLGK